MQKHDTWRLTARQIITRVLTQTAGRNENEIRQALKEAYPFEKIKFPAYLVWLNEIHLQRKRKSPVNTKPIENKNQRELF